MWKTLKEKHASAFGGGAAESKGDRSQDLTTILDRSQRADLTVLIGLITQLMRDEIEENFKPSDGESEQSEQNEQGEQSHDHGLVESRDDSDDEDDHSHPPIQLLDIEDDDGVPPHDSQTDKQPNDEFSRSHDVPSREPQKEEKKPNKEPSKSKYVPTSEDIKAEVNLLTQFDDWRDTVLLRIGEVVNREFEHPDQNQQTGNSQPDETARQPQTAQPDQKDGTWRRLAQVYPPVETPLLQLPYATRLLILHSLLLLMLSLEHYNANSRVLMLYAASSLGLGIKTLSTDEVKVARGLLDTALQLSASSEAEDKPKERDPTRKWKVGLATVAGAVLVGVTGGLAAPLLAAGLGTVMGGLGLGATAAAGYLGALAGSGVIVGGLFGAYGGRMTGKLVDKYAREVDDFAFLPVRGSRKRTLDEKEAARDDHRLRVTIGITGWLTEEENFVVPWRVIGSDPEVFGLRWETKPLLELGNAIDYLVTSAAWTAGGQVLSKTIFGGLLSAVILPLGLLKIARVADNPFSIAKARADKAGEVLADALISKVQGERPVTLVGYSLGSRVIFSCLQCLAKRHAYGLVENAILMGSPTPSDTPHWRRLRRVVTGRLVNVYSENDSVLAFLYRTSSLQLGIAGLQPIQNVPRVENINASEIISGHLRYQFLIGRILRMVGLEGINARELAREEAALAAKDRKQEERRVENERKAGISGDSEAARRKLETGEIVRDDEPGLPRQPQERSHENVHRLPRRPVQTAEPPKENTDHPLLGD